jgi:hypothetical protein
MLTDVSQRFGKMRVSHAGHGDQKVVGEIDGFHQNEILRESPSARQHFGGLLAINLLCKMSYSGFGAIFV